MTDTVHTNLLVETFVLDDEIQQRADGLDHEKVEEYTALFREQRDLGRIVVFEAHAGAPPLVADGFHRVSAARLAKLETLPAEVYRGTKRDAILYACGCNLHGKPPTNADKRHKVTTLLQDDTWRKWSDHEIARRCGVTHPFVGHIRASLETVTSENGHNETAEPVQRQYTNKHGQVQTMHTSAIGQADIPRCTNCLKPLSNPKSVSRGMGPVCACGGSDGGSAGGGSSPGSMGGMGAAAPPAADEPASDVDLDWLVDTAHEALHTLISALMDESEGLRWSEYVESGVEAIAERFAVLYELVFPERAEEADLGYFSLGEDDEPDEAAEDAPPHSPEGGSPASPMVAMMTQLGTFTQTSLANALGCTQPTISKSKEWKALAARGALVQEDGRYRLVVA